MNSKDLKNGKTFTFSTPDNCDDVRETECEYSDKSNKYIIIFNGQLYSFKTFKGMNNKLTVLKAKFRLTPKQN